MKKGSRKTNETYDFWNSFNTYLVIPFSLFSNLIAPTFKVREFFFEDITKLLQGTGSEPFPFFSPCTFVSFPFGKMVTSILWPVYLQKE
jgi:hypothetical protein